jgi:endoglucanase
LADVERAEVGRAVNVVLDVHHFDELYADTDRHTARFLALWSQIATRYASVGPGLSFELLNEPQDPMTAGDWNDLLMAALAAVRLSNPERTVIVGPTRWNTSTRCPGFACPTTLAWGTDADRARIRTDLAPASAWAQGRGRPLFLGEFGVHDNASMAARAAWTTFVRSEAERLGMTWAHWDFATDFGAFDLGRHAWRAPLKEALLGV